MLNDFRYGLRTLRRNPGFASTAIVSIGLAIGANAAIFSLADALFFRPLQVPEPSAVVTLATRPSRDNGHVSYPDYVDFREANRSFADLTAYRSLPVGFAKDTNTQPQLKLGFAVTASFFDSLRVVPQLGRGFRPEEDQVPRRDAVIVLGNDFWRNEFSSDPSVLGRHVRLNGIDFEVIGVVAESFIGLDRFARPAFFVPLMMAPSLDGLSDNSQLDDRQRRTLTAKGRLKPGVSVETASAEAAAIFAGLEKSHPVTNRSTGAAIRTEMQSRFDLDPYTPQLLGLLGFLVMLLLSIACGNVANLILSRAGDRTREAAVRLAIGAGRWRVVRQLMAENLLIGLAGGGLGLLVAAAAVRLILTFAPSSGLDVPTPLAIELDERALLLAFLIAVGSTLLFGLLPALRVNRTDLVPALKPGASERARERMFGRATLVVVQVAGSLVLLVAATQLARGFSYALSENHGFRTDHRLTMRFDPSLVAYSPARSQQFYRDLIERASSVPGVRSVALSSNLPLTTGFNGLAIAPEGFQFPVGQDSVSIATATVDHNFFRTLGVGIVRGRGFLETDRADSPWVAVVDETFARRYLGDNPIGKRIGLVGLGGRTAEVVGVSVPSKHVQVFMRPQNLVYLPFRQHPTPRMTLIAETDGDPVAMVGPLREVVRSLDINVPMFSVFTMEELFERRSVAVANMLVGIATAVGLVGLCLALIGLYAIVAYHVSRRTREIGIRMAIGAARMQVLGMILKHAAVMGVTGVVLGTIFSFAAGRGLTAALDTPSFDPLLFSVVPVALLVTTLLAAVIPARRAASIDPQQALRQD